MDTNSLKRFSTEARAKLNTGVAMMMQQLGFDAQGHAASMPERIGGGALMNGAVIADDRFYDRWMSLYHAIQLHGIREVYEEVAYTWFNRFMAIRIMRKNGFITPVLEYQSDTVHIPCIVADARRGVIPPMPEQDRRHLDEILLDDSKTAEQFAILIVAYCQNNPVLSRIFGRVNDYTALLLPKTILAPGDFVDMVNNTPFISDDDYKQSELIGWLYQFYISEKKDEVFAAFKNGSKAEAEDIPAATQIFTPNWIVKYMAQNTLGRIYLDNNPGSPLEAKWKYLVPQSDTAANAPKLQIKELEELTLLDPGSGSGHILVEGFDMLYDMYTAEFASPHEACEAILTKNITGLDIDTRAKQLAQFSLLMKACQKDDSFLDAKILPRVYDMPEPWEDKAGLYELLKKFFARDDRTAIQETVEAITLMDQAKNLGSIMKFGISERTRFMIERRMEELVEEGESGHEDVYELVPYFNVILALTARYATVAANPPYMNSNNMNDQLKSYVETEYPDGSADLMSVFMLVASEIVKESGLWSMIDLPSWMFLPSFQELRFRLINQHHINSLMQLGRGIFGSDFGSVVFVISNSTSNGKGYYRRLFDVQGQVRSVETIRDLFFKENYNCYFRNQDSFNCIPGNPIAFWISEKIVDAFSSFNQVRGLAEAKKGLSTGKNDLFLRLWFEVSSRKSEYNRSDFQTEAKWFPINKGGAFRKWYGDNEYVINWYHRGEEIKEFKGSVIRNEPYYLKESLTWTMLSASCFGIRFSPQGKLFEGAGPSLFLGDHETLIYLLGFLCSKLGDRFIRILNPTINININDVLNLPLIVENQTDVNTIINKNIGISQQDWDAHETSWDFQENEILGMDEDKYLNTIYGIYEGTGIKVDPEAPQLEDLAWRVSIYKAKWEDKFKRLHANEEELNRQFIEIYGLQEELTPDVPLDEVTILQQGEIKIENGELVWNDDVIVKQLISYIIGCYMGRYRLDRPGLAIAHPNAKAEEIAPYQIPGKGVEFVIDEDGLIPLLPAAAGFSDNGVQLVRQTIQDVLGTENYAANLNYIESCLGKPLEDYMAKDFWADHKKMYQNRPIYWLFSSKKGAFKVIAYMHRMTRHSVEQVRQKYLLPYLDKLRGQADEIQAKGAGASASERRSLQNLLKNIEECEEYHTRLHSVADQQISFDLDDGVVKNYALFGDVLAKIK
jgi:hypothetical protein